MVRNIRIEASSVNMDEMTFASNRPNVQRGNHSGPIIDRSGSSRILSSNADPSRGSPNLLGHMPPISQFLALEPLPMMDQRCKRSGDLRKVLVNGTARTAPAKLSNSVPIEELKRFKSTVLDTSIKARGRVKKMDECLHKVNKYGETLNSMKQQTNESSNERSAGSSLLRMGSQIPRNSVDFVNRRLEDRTKSISLNKRIRSSMAENRSEGQASSIMRQPLFLGKERDVEGSDRVEEKIHKLPGGGESWKKKMRRKRSAGNVFSRAMNDSDGELEKVTQKMNNVPGVQVSKGFRLLIDEGTAIENPAPPMKGKASIASRIGLTVAADSPSSLQSPSKVHLTNGSNNRKRAMPSGSSPIAQWGSQRPQKMFRTRRTNLVSPLSNHDEVPTSADGCTSGLGTKAASVSRTFASGISSPSRLSESEESAACESHEAGAVVRKSNLKKVGYGGGLQKEGRKSRGSLTGPPLVVKLEIGNSKPLKNGSKSRRPPLKKLSDTKGFSRSSKTLTSSSPAFVGESDDDQELHAAACSASSASNNACSGSFWKKMENLFSSIRRDDISYLEQQVKSSGESHKNLLKNSSNDQVELARPGNSIDQVETEGMELPLYRRVLAALIIEEDVATQDKVEGRKSKDNDGFGYNQFMANLQLPSQPNFERFAVSSNPPSQMTYDEFCGNGLQDRLDALSNGIDISCDEGYLQKPIESELFTELHNIGLSPDNVPDLADGDEGIDNEISYLQKKHIEKVGKNKALLSQLFKVVKEDEQMNQRALEQTAMDKLVEMAYWKQLATRASYASKHGIPKVSKHAAANFAKRTLARCRKFEETGQSCFGESPFREVLSAPPPSVEVQTGSDTHLLASPGPDGGKKANFGHLSETFATTGWVSSRSKKKELPLDEVGGIVSFGITTGFGKRSKNVNFKDNQKTKTKKKIGRLPTSCSNASVVQTESSDKMVKEASFKEKKKDSADLMKLDLQMESIGDLDVQSWLNYEGDGLQDDCSMGLEIPMDDLSDIFA